jgi:DNA excision repair protein ERCC-2
MLEQGHVEHELMSRLAVSSVTLGKMSLKLMELGEEVRELKKARHKLPRSYMGSMGAFMKTWMEAEEDTHIKVILDEENPTLQAYCMDSRMAAEPLRLCRASVHMSGTLEPMGTYAEELDLPAPAVRRFPSPFPPENLMVIHAGDVTTKYEVMQEDPGNIVRLEDHVVRIAASVRRNTAVFLPSYALMDRFIEDKVPERIGREAMFERRNMSQSDLMDNVCRFSAAEGAVIFAVTGGRISEGLDFPDRALELAILVGIPYPKASVRQMALVRFCDYRFGDGWSHAVQVPAVRKMRQAIGRLIRSPTDRGAAVILDYRIGAVHGIESVQSEDPEGAVLAFFSRARSQPII